MIIFSLYATCSYYSLKYHYVTCGKKMRIEVKQLYFLINISFYLNFCFTGVLKHASTPHFKPWYLFNRCYWKTQHSLSRLTPGSKSHLRLGGDGAAIGCLSSRPWEHVIPKIGSDIRGGTGERRHHHSPGLLAWCSAYHRNEGDDSTLARRPTWQIMLVFPHELSTLDRYSGGSGGGNN